MIRSVVKKGDQKLGRECRAVTDIESVQEILRDLHDTLNEMKNIYSFTRGSGIAAPQIGENVRICVVEYDSKRHTLINPTITSHSDEKLEIRREGCLSFFSYRGYPRRFTDVTVTYLDEEGKKQTLEACGDFASLLQHEIDHLDGILYTQRMNQDQVLEFHPEMPDIP
ncbi:MAG TPA: peptide deformylase [Acidimicrobiia bacterium]|jgi:peptide deformylase|nr:peptide deformylase [Acidimicrobiia bacterium]